MIFSNWWCHTTNDIFRITFKCKFIIFIKQAKKSAKNLCKNFVKNQLIPIIILNLVIGFSSTGIDNFGHIGGLVGGVLGTMAIGIEGKSTTTERINGVILSIIYIALVIYMGFVYTA